MTKIVIISVVMLIVFGFIYMKYIQNEQLAGGMAEKGKMNWLMFGMLLTFAFVIRIVAGMLYKGHETDMACFSAWSDMVYQNGFSNFYSTETFTDYPPGYMYILFVIGWLKSAIPALAGNYLILKLPAMICDLIAGGLIYKVAKRRFSENASLILASMYLFSPAVIVNSAVWGQVDSVLTIFVALMCYLVAEKKLIPAYFVFAIGILMKPQAVVFTPVLIFGIIDQVILENFEIERFLKELFMGLLAIGCMVVACLPFGLEKVIAQYMETLKSYPYATVNAYNFWAFLGKNWHGQEEKWLGLEINTWGTIAIVLLVVFATFVWWKCRKSKGKYFFLGALLICLMFTFSARMHERYMFPAMILLLLAFLYEPRKETMISYIILSAIHFVSVTQVLFFFDAANYDWDSKLPNVCGFILLVCIGYLIYNTFKCYMKSWKEEEAEEAIRVNHFAMNRAERVKKEPTIQRTEKAAKFTKIDWSAMFAIMLVYGVIALYDLGSHKMPQTQWETREYYTTITLDMGAPTQLSKIHYFLGNYENRDFTLETANDINGPWENTTNFQMASVFAWGQYDTDLTARYFRLTSNSDCCVIREMVLKDAAGNTLMPVNASEYPELFDEQELLPERSTFRDSTYFDEIYHGRTAYEFMQGIYCYENTHPPLGKGFIALGMMIFGVNPFGWRIMGCLFGIAMLPVLYLFAKRIFKESWMAIITTTLLAADFMHFTQTRIATIDVFVTFFVILMYYFMYRYTQYSFYDSKLSKTLVPLGCCGVAMGLGIASKWTGIYAGAGLAVIFFWQIFKRYYEYTIALKNPKGETNGIKHEHVIKSFTKNTVITLACCIVFFIIVPGIIYGLSYLPFNDGSGEGWWKMMIRNQTTMYEYHSKLDATHPFSSKWWQWPIIYRPIWYYSGHVSDTVAEGISAFGNPLIWWLGIPAFLYMLYLAFKDKDKNAIFLTIGYLAQYTPWFLVSRCIFIYHYFPSVPFVVLMVAYSIYKISQKETLFGMAMTKKKWIKTAFIYTAAVVILFAMFYPVLSGEPVAKSYVNTFLRWFDSWVLLES